MCVPLMVSCSGFGLPLHAQLLRLFVTKMLQQADKRRVAFIPMSLRVTLLMATYVMAGSGWKGQQAYHTLAIIGVGAM